MDEMSTPTISPKVCGGLLSKTLPEVIETDRELGHFADALETLDRLDRELKPEEKLLEALLSRLIADYDKKVELPQLPPHKTIAFPRELAQILLPEPVAVISPRSSSRNSAEIRSHSVAGTLTRIHSSPAAPTYS
jgi:hypothetical protein